MQMRSFSEYWDIGMMTHFPVTGIVPVHIKWASGNHSGTYVPLYAIGCGAEQFHGVMDNTDIPKTIEKVAIHKTGKRGAKQKSKK